MKYKEQINVRISEEMFGKIAVYAYKHRIRKISVAIRELLESAAGEGDGKKKAKKH